MATKSKMEGTQDLGRFLREVCDRKHDIPRKQLKMFMHGPGGKSFRSIWNDQFGPKARDRS